jgi:cell division protein FtsW
MPANTAALALLLMVVTLLVLQPDFGQTMLIALVWGALFFMAGMRLIWVGGLAGLAGVGLVGAYFTVPHVAQRIQRFMDRGSGDTFNIDLALESFARGGWFGKGPGEGTVKRILPESHTDFVFAVGAEEFGLVFLIYGSASGWLTARGARLRAGVLGAVVTAIISSLIWCLVIFVSFYLFAGTARQIVVFRAV